MMQQWEVGVGIPYYLHGGMYLYSSALGPSIVSLNTNKSSSSSINMYTSVMGLQMPEEEEEEEEEKEEVVQHGISALDDRVHSSDIHTRTEVYSCSRKIGLFCSLVCLLCLDFGSLLTLCLFCLDFGSLLTLDTDVQLLWEDRKIGLRSINHRHTDTPQHDDLHTVARRYTYRYLSAYNQ